MHESQYNNLQIMNKTKLTKLVLDAVLSRKDKHNKTTQLAMAVNGTYVEDTTYVDDKVQWLFEKSENEVSVQYSNISKMVEKINSLEPGSVGLILTEEQASKFSILAGLTGVEIIDLSQKDMYDSFGPQLAAFGVDITGVVLVVSFSIDELDNNTKFIYDSVEYTLLPADEPSAPTLETTTTAPVFDCVNTSGLLTNTTVSQFTLGDNVVVDIENNTISPYILFLTDEQYSKFSVSATKEDGVSQEDFEQVLAGYGTPLQVSMLANNPPFEVPQNATYFISFGEFMSTISHSHYMSSITITYDGTDYVYTSDKIITTSQES